MAKTPTEDNAELHQPALPPVVMAHEHLDHALDLWQDRAIYRCASKRSQERFHKDTVTRELSDSREHRFHEDTVTRDCSKSLLEMKKLWKVHKLANIRHIHGKQKPVPGTSYPPVWSFKFLLLRMETEGLYNIFSNYKQVRFSLAQLLDRRISIKIFQNHMVWGRCPSQRGGERKPMRVWWIHHMTLKPASYSENCLDSTLMNFTLHLVISKWINKQITILKQLFTI